MARGWHDAHHFDDFHCNSHGERHLHVQEHNCSVCDISIPVTDGPAAAVASVPFIASRQVCYSSPSISATTAIVTALHLRGPPAIG